MYKDAPQLGRGCFYASDDNGCGIYADMPVFSEHATSHSDMHSSIHPLIHPAIYPPRQPSSTKPAIQPTASHPSTHIRTDQSIQLIFQSPVQRPFHLHGKPRIHPPSHHFIHGNVLTSIPPLGTNPATHPSTPPVLPTIPSPSYLRLHCSPSRASLPAFRT